MLRCWYERLSILSNVYVYYIVIEVQVFDFDIHKASLPNTGREEEVSHYPTLILGKTKLLDIGFLQ
jgi:hypothetical protein